MPSAIVTGSDSGIGRATAVALAGDGFDVGITYREQDGAARDAAREVEQRGRRAVVRQLRLGQLDEIPGIIAGFADDLGGLDALVCNAGFGHGTPFLDLSLDEWRAVVERNVHGTFMCAQAGALTMVEQGRGGRIVNVTSVHEHAPLRGSAGYCAAKGAIGMLTKVMALELAEHGITVNAVAPGEVATPMTGARDVDPATIQRPMIPAGRPGDAHEIGAAIAFLCSPRASYVTGESLVVDGGLLLMAAVANQRVGTG